MMQKERKNQFQIIGFSDAKFGILGLLQNGKKKTKKNEIRVCTV